MQQTQDNIKQKKIPGICIRWAGGIAWVAGLLLAGSDSVYMPWLNGTGLLIFFCASCLIGRAFHSSFAGPRVSKQDQREGSCCGNISSKYVMES